MCAAKGGWAGWLPPNFKSNAVKGPRTEEASGLRWQAGCSKTVFLLLAWPHSWQANRHQRHARQATPARDTPVKPHRPE